MQRKASHFLNSSVSIMSFLTLRVMLLVDEDGDLFAESARVVVSVSGLNHGLAVHDDYLYASTSSTVFRWPDTLIDLVKSSYDLSTSKEESQQIDKEIRKLASSQREVVVKNMNDAPCFECGAEGGHSTRTLVFDSEGRLYVSVGSEGNVDSTSFRSRIRRFNL